MGGCQPQNLYPAKISLENEKMALDKQNEHTGSQQTCTKWSTKSLTHRENLKGKYGTVGKKTNSIQIVGKHVKIDYTI